MPTISLSLYLMASLSTPVVAEMPDFVEGHRFLCIQSENKVGTKGVKLFVIEKVDGQSLFESLEFNISNFETIEDTQDWFSSQPWSILSEDRALLFTRQMEIVGYEPPLHFIQELQGRSPLRIEIDFVNLKRVTFDQGLNLIAAAFSCKMYKKI